MNKDWIRKSGGISLKTGCGSLAPVATNGAWELTCSLEEGHEGDHSITLKWR